MADHDLAFIVYEGSKETARVPWAAQRLVIGRRHDADLRIQEPTMSSVHAEIVDADDGLRIRDLNSLNGTQVNGTPVFDALLQLGDRIQVGRASIVVASVGETPEAPSDLDRLAEDSAQTVKVRMAALRESRGVRLEDQRIIILRDLVETLKSFDDTERILDQVRTVLQQAYRSARVFILRPNEAGEWRDEEPTDERPSFTFVAEAARSASAILSTSLPGDERFATSESVRITGIQTAIAAPTSCDEETVAVIYVDRLGLPAFTKRDLHLLGIAANHVSAVLENAARIADLQQARERLAALNRELEERVEERTAEIRRQAAEIAQLAEAKDELLGIAAHDIRGPLTVIMGTTELLQLQIDQLETETVRQNLQVVHDASQGLGQMLSELLDAKAVEAGKIHLEKRRLPVHTVFEHATLIARLAAQNKRIAVNIEAPLMLQVDADPHRLAQAITNLLLNAIKFSPPGSRIGLQASAASGREGIEIVVEDQGVGIPEEELESIFSSFSQGRAGKQLGGSGLGLMIAKRLVELHDGTLQVASEVGVGTRFILSLP